MPSTRSVRHGPGFVGAACRGHFLGGGAAMSFRPLWIALMRRVHQRRCGWRQMDGALRDRRGDDRQVGRDRWHREIRRARGLGKLRFGRRDATSGAGRLQQVQSEHRHLSPALSALSAWRCPGRAAGVCQQRVKAARHRGQSSQPHGRSRSEHVLGGCPSAQTRRRRPNAASRHRPVVRVASAPARWAE